MASACPAPSTVLIADPDELLRLGLAALLTEAPAVAVTTKSLGRVLEAARRLQPDLIVLDPKRRDGLDLPLLRELALASPQSHLCLYTTVFEPTSFLEALLAGVHAYLLKGHWHGAALRQTLALVAQASVVVLDHGIIDYFRDQPAGTLVARVPSAGARQVTDRERAVLALLATGLTEKDVGARLGIRRTTVGSHACNVSLKLGTENAVQLGAVAFAQGLVRRADTAVAAVASTDAEASLNQR